MINLADTFKSAGIYFELYDHRAIYTNEDAVIIKEEQGFVGTETKSLFLKNKKDDHFIFFTFTTKSTDFKKIKQLVGQRLSVVKPEEMEALTGQKPGAVSPFGYEEKVPMIIDAELLLQEKLVFAPGRPDQTMVVLVKDLSKIVELLSIETYDYPLSKSEDN
ncbi:YbaK/EbsC family protein [Vagococcus sp.]|uniref:YbaK/EbsC family protein n=1 Tax=Vagococcus sp. TaxID=1933889 RepID=UPI003F9E414B